LSQRGLDEEAAGRRRLSSLTPEETLQEFRAKHSGLRIPYLDAGGRPVMDGDKPFARVRLLPEGFAALMEKPQKFAQQKGTANHLYLDPAREDWQDILADPGVPIVITEGEVKAMCATEHGIVCIALGGVWSWKTKASGTSLSIPELDGVVWKDRVVEICFDSDAAQNPQVSNARLCLGLELWRRGADVHLVNLPPTEDEGKQGLDDFLIAHGSEAFDTLHREQVSPIKALSLLNPIEYDRARKDVAKHLNITLSTLDKEVSLLRKAEETPSHSNLFESVVPWEEPVRLDQVLEEVVEALRRHAVMTDDERVAIALWTAFTWVVHRRQEICVSPMLALLSSDRRCGKTTVLSILSKVVSNPLASGNISPAATYRVMEHQPTLLMDELDTYSEKNHDLWGIVNSAHTRETAFVVRVEKLGEELVPTRFSSWGAKCVAKIGDLLNTWHDRSIVIRMKRRRPDEPVTGLRRVELEALGDIARKLARWADDISTWPRVETPGGIHDRAADNWEPLLTVARLASESWLRRAEKAAKALSDREADGVTESQSVELLSDVREVFILRRAGRITAEQLVEGLLSLESGLSQWMTCNKGKPLNTKMLRAKLLTFGISPPRSQRGEEVNSKRGRRYMVEDFLDAWSRHLDPVDEVLLQVSKKAPEKKKRY
jgi:putative DNA primase/helicase